MYFEYTRIKQSDCYELCFRSTKASLYVMEKKGAIITKLACLQAGNFKLHSQVLIPPSMCTVNLSNNKKDLSVTQNF